MKTFPLTLAAIKTADNSQWAIGDALIKECGPPSENGKHDGSYLAEAAKYLLDEGYKYEASTLSRFRSLAHSFAISKRRSQVSWGAHSAAGTPAFLEAVIAGAPKGTRITQPYIEGIRRAQAEHARKEREEAAEKARAERLKAEKEEAEARAKEHEAKEEKEKEKAHAKLEKAKAKTRAAKEKEQETKNAPKKKPSPPPENEVPQLVAEAQFIAHATKSVSLARKAIEDIRTCLHELTPVGVSALTTVALEAANAWKEAAQLVRSEILDQRGHLSVVGE